MTAPHDVPSFDPRALADLQECDPDGSLVRELLEVFLDDTPRRVQALHMAFDAGDPSALMREAHALKSSCAQLGAAALSAHCRRLEQLGRDGSLAGVGDLLDDVDRELERVRQAMTAEQNRRR